MSGRWWRAYDEALHDPKLVGLSDRLHRAWFCLLCVASKNGGILPAIDAVALELRTTVAKATEYITELVTRGLFDELEPGKFSPHNWKGRQFKSDVSTERVKRFRERDRNVSETLSEAETESESETEPEPDATLRVVPAPTKRRTARAPLRDDFVPEGYDPAVDQEELRRFRNHAIANGRLCAGERGWQAAWRNWKNSPYLRNRHNGQRKTGSELAFQLAAEARERERATGIFRSDDALGGD